MLGMLNIKSIEQKRAERLGHAIDQGNLPAVKDFLNKGVTRAHFVQYGLDERGLDKVPVSVMSDPYEILKVSSLPVDQKRQMWDLLAQHIPPHPSAGPSLKR